MTTPKFNSQILIRQQGIVLFTALIMLVIMSILGISSIRGIALEERMTGNAYDQSLAFQAAEAALRAGEQETFALSAGSEPEDVACNPESLLSSASAGYISQTSLQCPPDWMSTAALETKFSASAKQLDASVTNLGTLAGTAPRYLIEYLGGNAPCYPGLNPDKKYDACTESVQDCTCHRFRVTAMSTPGEGRATVILQSVFFTR